MSARTVDSHLQRLYQRYDVHSRAAMVAKWLLGGGLRGYEARTSTVRQ
jgi:hypothetical protein